MSSSAVASPTLDAAAAPAAPFSNKPQQSSRGGNRSSQEDNDKQLYAAISAKTQILVDAKIAMATTITIYVPTPAIGAVIGRRGQNILQLQKQMALSSSTSTSSPPVVTPRVSVVGEHDPPDSIPYTYSALDWSDSQHWTPVVIRAGDVCAALQAATRVLQLAGGVHDEVVLDLPLPCQKYHSALVGRRGVVLACMSADHNVRILVPHKESHDDMIQLEGDLANVKSCLVPLLTAAAAVAVPGSNNSNKGGGAAQQNKTKGGENKEKQESAVLMVTQLPSHSKLRQVRSKTDTIVRKRKINTYDNGNNNKAAADKWQLTILGNTPEQVQTALVMLQQHHQLQRNNSSNADGDNNNNTPTNNSNNTGRGRGRGRKGGGGTPKRNKGGGGGGGATPKSTGSFDGGGGAGSPPETKD